MGGAFALLLASGRGFSASSVNYGGKLPADVDSFLATACPIVASYGAKDRWNQGVADQLERALERALIAHDVKEYPDAGHSFMNNHQSIFFKALRFAGIAYNEPATAQFGSAWRTIEVTRRCTRSAKGRTAAEQWGSPLATQRIGPHNRIYIKRLISF